MAKILVKGEAIVKVGDEEFEIPIEDIIEVPSIEDISTITRVIEELVKKKIAERELPENAEISEINLESINPVEEEEEVEEKTEEEELEKVGEKSPGRIFMLTLKEIPRQGFLKLSIRAPYERSYTETILSVRGEYVKEGHVERINRTFTLQYKMPQDLLDKLRFIAQLVLEGKVEPSTLMLISHYLSLGMFDTAKREIERHAENDQAKSVLRLIVDLVRKEPERVKLGVAQALSFLAKVASDVKNLINLGYMPLDVEAQVGTRTIREGVYRLVIGGKEVPLKIEAQRHFKFSSLPGITAKLLFKVLSGLGIEGARTSGGELELRVRGPENLIQLVMRHIRRIRDLVKYVRALWRQYLYYKTLADVSTGREKEMYEKKAEKIYREFVEAREHIDENVLQPILEMIEKVEDPLTRRYLEDKFYELVNVIDDVVKAPRRTAREIADRIGYLYLEALLASSEAKVRHALEKLSEYGEALNYILGKLGALEKVPQEIAKELVFSAIALAKEGAIDVNLAKKIYRIFKDKLPATLRDLAEEELNKIEKGEERLIPA